MGNQSGKYQTSNEEREPLITVVQITDLNNETNTDTVEDKALSVFRKILERALWFFSLPISYLKRRKSFKSVTQIKEENENSQLPTPTVLENKDQRREIVCTASINQEVLSASRKYTSFNTKFKEISSQRKSTGQYNRDELLIAAIDFGTTYSGWTLSIMERGSGQETDTDFIGERLVSERQPTSVLIQPDGKTFDSFGYEAEKKYSSLEAGKSHKQWYFFKRFKTLLSGRVDNIDRKIMLKDWTGKEIPAQVVFSSAIQYLKTEVIKIMEESLPDEESLSKNVNWALNVPANWSDAAKQFMREAAQKAGIPQKKLKISLESEAASLFCKQLPVKKNIDSDQTPTLKFETGKKYVVLVAGGGTIDITVHELLADGTIREIEKASGGELGGATVDEAFETFLTEITGKEVILTFKEEYPSEYMKLFEDFDTLKKLTTPDNKGTILMTIPCHLTDLVQQQKGHTIQERIVQTVYKDKISMKDGNIEMDQDVMRSFFEKTINGILEQVELLMKKSQVAESSAIVMVGGFAESPMLQQGVQKRFNQLEVVIPEDPSLAVVEGTAIYGQNPTTISERICKFTYGFDLTHDTSSSCEHPPGRKSLDDNGIMRCWDIFLITARVGQAVKIGEEGEEFITCPLYATQTEVGFEIYVSTSEHPYFVTERGCTKIGSLTVPIPDISLGTSREFGVRFKFGGTEIEVKVVDKTTGQSYTTSVDFLG